VRGVVAVWRVCLMRCDMALPASLILDIAAFDRFVFGLCEDKGVLVEFSIVVGSERIASLLL